MKDGVASNYHLSVIAVKFVHVQFPVCSKFLMNMCHAGLLLAGDVCTSKKNEVITASVECGGGGVPKHNLYIVCLLAFRYYEVTNLC